MDEGNWTGIKAQGEPHGSPFEAQAGEGVQLNSDKLRAWLSKAVFLRTAEPDSLSTVAEFLGLSSPSIILQLNSGSSATMVAVRESEVCDFVFPTCGSRYQISSRSRFRVAFYESKAQQRVIKICICRCLSTGLIFNKGVGMARTFVECSMNRIFCTHTDKQTIIEP